MGNNPSKPFPDVQSIVAQQKSLLVKSLISAPDPKEQSEKLRIELNMAKNDVKSKQEQLDKLAPEEANARKTHHAQIELDKYTNETKNKYDNEIKVYNILLEQINTMANSGAVKIAKKYKAQVKHNQDLLKAVNAQQKEIAFTNRRRFLDSEPQKPVGGFLSFQSTDAQVMLAFWISYLLIITAISTILLSKYGAYLGSPKNIIIIMTVVVFVLIIIAHLIIQAVATRI